MEEVNKVYRIRTKVGDNAPNVINVPLNQTYDMFEILSLKLGQTNTYKTYKSDYGIIVGRVIANGGFGIENAKVSVFIEVDDDIDLKDRLLYNFTSVNDTDKKGIRYNLLPDYVDDACHQNVGTFPNKRLVLDNQDVIEIFDKYWKYTTTTNHAGDYMIFGVPVGSQNVHADVDLSDCGVLSQRPRDMMAKGYNETMFESPNKFKSSENLNSLVQIVSQDKGVYVYPYWGDVSDGDDEYGITRCDINIEYKFESYAVFMGSIITDKGNNAIGKNCDATDNNGRMEDLISGEGRIEMIRKTIDNKVEEFPIMGNRLIDGDGVWCYQIPMNLDYVTTDEFGNLVPTDNPDKGIATRTRVRFRITLDENPNDVAARKRASYLIPNNPRLDDEEFGKTHEPDYEFGSLTREESYCDLFWNKVYSVKNYIPKLQKNSHVTSRKHTGIKWINYPGDNNPMPYNALTMKLSFTYRLLCNIAIIFIDVIEILNTIIAVLGSLPCWIYKVVKKIPIVRYLAKKAYDFVPSCIELSSGFCYDGINPYVWYPGCNGIGSCVWDETKKACDDKYNKGKSPQDKVVCKKGDVELKNCVQTELAESNDAASFSFHNDWINGTLYAPLWYRKIRQKKRYFFGLFVRRAKDEWCTANDYFKGMHVMQACAISRPKQSSDNYDNFDGEQVTPRYVGKVKIDDESYDEKISELDGLNGVIMPKETLLNEIIYYYVPVQFDEKLANNKGEVKLFFATDIILLGSLNDCDMNGIPQFFKALDSTTYNMPESLLFNTYIFTPKFDEDGKYVEEEYDVISEAAGRDWGNKNEYVKIDGGLFYDVTCNSIHFRPKSCVNLIRICEFGVSLDETKEVADLGLVVADRGDNAFTKLTTDGFVSWDELFNLDERSMFATMNGNKLRTKLNEKNGLLEYDFRYLYPDNFDGSLGNIMEDTTKKYDSKINYKNNYKLERFSRDYYVFRMGNNPFFYDKDGVFPRYENSYYFYFGLKAGKTAIEKFNSKYFAECYNADNTYSQIKIQTKENSWCSEYDTESEQDEHGCKVDNACDGYVAFDLSKVEGPYELTINGVDDADYSLYVNQITDEKIIITNDFNNDLQNEFTDYKQLKVNSNNCSKYDSSNHGEIVPMLKNGSYSAILTDEDGEENPFTFKIQGKYLTFETTVQNFEIDSSIMKTLFATPYDVVHNDVDKLKHERNVTDWICDTGGVITIKNIDVYGEERPDYKIEIRPKKEIKWHETVNNTTVVKNWIGIIIEKHGTSISATETIENGGQNRIQNINGNNTEQWARVAVVDGVTFFGVKVPVGDINYDVIVTQLCNINNVWEDSNNSVKTSVKVEYPIPFKLYINDVDYDLVKEFGKVIVENGDDPHTSTWPKTYRLENSYGWIPSGKIDNKRSNMENLASISGANSKVGRKNRGIIYNNNPWFNIHNIWSDDKFKKIESIETLELVDLYFDNEETFNTTEYQGTFVKINFIPIDIEVGETFNTTVYNESSYVVVYTEETPDGVYYVWNGSRYEVITDTREKNGYYEWQQDNTYHLTDINGIKNSVKNKTVLLKTIEKESKYLDLETLMEEFTRENVNRYSLSEIDGRTFNVSDGFSTRNRVYYTWSGDYIASDYDLVTSFSDVSIYDEDNIQDLLNEVNGFIDKANEIIDLRNDLPSLMLDSFFLTCPDQEKTIDITVRTSNKPATVIMVHQEETEDEETGERALTNNRLFIIEEDSITVGIPTITYASEPDYGIVNHPNASTPPNSIYDGERYTYQNFEPVLTKYNNRYDRDAFYVAVADKKANTKPEGLKTTTSGDTVVVRRDNNKLEQIFPFPIIDLRTKVDYVAWSYFDNIPFYNKKIGNDYDLRGVTMYGLLGGNILNGNVINNKFATQTLNDMTLLLTDNTLVGAEVRSYAENRLIYGYEATDCFELIKRTLQEMANSVQDLLNDAQTIEDIQEYLVKQAALVNLIRSGALNFNSRARWNSNYTEVDEEIYCETRCFDIIDGLYYEKGDYDINNIRYFDGTDEENYIVSYTCDIETVMKNLANFRWIIDSNKLGITGYRQYAELLQKQTEFDLRDSSGCGISETIYGNLYVTPGENMVNDCRENVGTSIPVTFPFASMTIEIPTGTITNRMLVDVKTNVEDYEIYYTISKVDAYHHRYPLDLVEVDELGHAILPVDSTKYIWGKYNGQYDTHTFLGQEYNLFSFAMKTDDLRDTETTDDEHGTGRHKLLDTTFKSQILEYDENGEVDNTDTKGYGNTGIFTHDRRGEDEVYPVFIIAETPNHCRAISPVYEFANVRGSFAIGTKHNSNGTTNRCFGVKLKSKADGTVQHYLNYYPYDLSAIISFGQTSETIEIYEQTLSKLNKYIFTNVTEEDISSYNSSSNNTRDIEIDAYDYTGLKHVARVVDIDTDKHWYSVVWDANLDADAPNGIGIIDDDNEIVRRVEDFYEGGDMINFSGSNENARKVKDTKGYRFKGWATSTDGQPLTQSILVQNVLSFYAQWEETLCHWVHFLDTDGETEILSLIQYVEHGGYATEPSGIFADEDWYVKNDESQNIVNFNNYVIENETWFVRKLATKVTLTFKVNYSYDENNS